MSRAEVFCGPREIIFRNLGDNAFAGTEESLIRLASPATFCRDLRTPRIYDCKKGELEPVDQCERMLIFDFGMHKAFDTKFYLDKGFRVVALEANPRLVADAQARLGEFVQSGQLTIVERALWKNSGETVHFFISSFKDEWSSLDEWRAKKGGLPPERVDVQTTTLPELFDRYGVPYYIKCDIEGGDITFVKQLEADHRRPKFVSVEALNEDLMNGLRRAGYNQFQIVNQMWHPRTVCPNPSLEGTYVETKFHGQMSGLFGLELPAARWRSLEQTLTTYRTFRALRVLDETLAPGWLDIHARHG